MTMGCKPVPGTNREGSGLVTDHGFEMMRSKGYSLVETLIVIVLVSIIAGIGYPRLRTALVKSDVRSARTTMITLYQKTKAAAMESSRPTTLHFNGTSAWITAIPRLMPGMGIRDTIGPVENLYTRYGVAVSATPVANLVVNPRGWGTSGWTTVFVSRAGYTDSMVVSAFGRVQK